MTGPYVTLAVACDAATARVASAEVMRDATAAALKDTRCRLLDTKGNGAAVLIVDRPIPGMPYRDYVVALRHDGAWWLSPTASTLDLSGNAWGAGNCCSGAAGTPRYALWTPTGTGFDVALHTELHVWRVYRPGWGTGTGNDAGSHKLVGDYLFCGERPGATPACIAVEAPHCAPNEQPTISLAATDVTTTCTARR